MERDRGTVGPLDSSGKNVKFQGCRFMILMTNHLRRLHSCNASGTAPMTGLTLLHLRCHLGSMTSWESSSWPSPPPVFLQTIIEEFFYLFGKLHCLHCLPMARLTFKNRSLWTTQSIIQQSRYQMIWQAFLLNNPQFNTATAPLRSPDYGHCFDDVWALAPAPRDSTCSMVSVSIMFYGIVMMERINHSSSVCPKRGLSLLFSACKIICQNLKTHHKNSFHDLQIEQNKISLSYQLSNKFAIWKTNLTNMAPEKSILYMICI